MAVPQEAQGPAPPPPLLLLLKLLLPRLLLRLTLLPPCRMLPELPAARELLLLPGAPFLTAGLRWEEESCRGRPGDTAGRCCTRACSCTVTPGERLLALLALLLALEG